MDHNDHCHAEPSGPKIGLLWSNIGRRTAIWLPIITVPQIVLFGYALNIFVVA